MKKIRTEIKREISKDPQVKFVGDAYVIDDEPVIYTGNLIIIFKKELSVHECVSLLNDHSLDIEQDMSDIGNVWLVADKNNVNNIVFELSEKLLQNPVVDACYPEIIRCKADKVIHSNQWHLKPTVVTHRTEINASANVEEAHKITKGTGIVVAIIDDAVDITHPEFSAPGKIVYPANFNRNYFDNNPMPRSVRESHGTYCAGVAVAGGLSGASGVAPESRLMPIRLADNLGSFNEARAFIWAAQNDADIISCSWGPPDGKPLVPNDPFHRMRVAVPPHTQRAMDYAAEFGRDGKGCAIFFAAGNGNERVENDGYASYKYVIAVAACNDISQRSFYSDYGASVFCAFPSNDQLSSLTPGIWTTGLTSNAGYNANGDYVNNFGGTSSACPGAAGVAALILSVHPDLTLVQLKDLMRRGCDKIGANVNTQEYDQNGQSLSFGYGRLNAATSVRLALR